MATSFSKPRLPRLDPAVNGDWVSTASTPGCNVAKSVHDRPFNGSSRIVVESTTAPIDDDAKSIVGASVDTRTTSATCPTFKIKFKTRWLPTVNVMSVSTLEANPAAEAVISYDPGKRFVAVQNPAGPVVTRRITPFASFLTNMVAYGTTAPDRSVLV